MKVLVTTHPGLGHLHPMVPIMQTLQQSGHQVAVACAPSFRSTVEDLGFKSFSCGLDWLEWEAARTFPQLQEMPLERQHLWFLTEVFSSIVASSMVPDLLTVARSWKPDIIVRNDYEFSSCIAAEILGIPQATIGVDFFMSGALLDLLVGAQLNEVRRVHGLAPSVGLEMLYPYLYLSLIPPSYQFIDESQIPFMYSVRPLTFDQSGNEALPSWIDNLPAQPTVYVTLGTVFNRLPELYRIIIEALGKQPINLIVTLGRNQDPSELGKTSDNVYVERYVPQSLLLPHCDLLIISGSVNTVVAALGHGLPMLLMPLSSTQPFHAMRCVALGVGLVLKEHGEYDAYLFDRYHGELTSEAIRKAVKELLNNPNYRTSARRLRDEIRSLPGTEKAVELLVRVAKEGTPHVARP